MKLNKLQKMELNNLKIKKLFLIIAFLAVSIIGFLYGIDPQWFVRKFLGLSQVDANIAHILRSIMCLYLALGLFWLYAAFSDTYRNAAVLTTIIFSGGLVTGRIISYFSEGQPAPILILYIFMEFALVPIAYWIFKLED